MKLQLDISADEMPIFLAETEEHLQTLEENLVRIEQEESDADLIQALFRAAHTLKGMAGMVGHTRLVNLTHVLETAFDGVRKGNLGVSSGLIDLCLDAIDALRVLRDEVVQESPDLVDIEPLVEQFSIFLETSIRANQIETLESTPNQASHLHIKPKAEAAPKAPQNGNDALFIEAHIASNSIASAARAFQLMMALQSLGKIIDMSPTQAEIESVAPVSIFTARLETSQSIEDVRKELSLISEVEKLSIRGKEVEVETTPEPPSQPAEEPAIAEPTKLGEYLVSQHIISQKQLESALSAQKQYRGAKLGQILIELGILSEPALENHVDEFLRQQRVALQNIQSAGTEKSRVADKTVRTSVERLDNLMNLVGELITDRNRLNQLRNKLEAEQQGNDLVMVISETVGHIGRITDQLQEEVMQIRMLPIANIFNKFPRMVRDLARKTNKEVELLVSGQETELDRSLLEEINDPLIHLVRNAVDHGIETPEVREAAGKPREGTVRLSAHHEQGRIVLTVADDGKGINTDKLKASAVKKGLITESEAAAMNHEKAVDLIFMPGLSTNEKVTDISGRGVGMDIVQNNILRLNGTILVETEPGKGTTFQIILPLTLAIIPTLLVHVEPITFAIPLVTVLETQRLTKASIQTINGRPVTIIREKVLPLVYLSDTFDLQQQEQNSHHNYVVIVQSSKQQFGLVVDSLVGEEEVVVKSLGALIGEVPGISSAAILGDGKVALIVDVQSLVRLASAH